jgi:predicted GNAT family acetyltransferase
MSEDVRADEERSRYEVFVDGKPAGFTQYRLTGNVARFIHTEIDPAFEGRGLGSTLIEGALEDTRRRGRQILPHCPFVRSFVAKHPEYVELVPEDRRAEFDLPV